MMPALAESLAAAIKIGQVDLAEQISALLKQLDEGIRRRDR